MQTIIDLILTSGETGINLALYVLLPVMVVMMSLMRVLEDRGVLTRIAIFISPLLIFYGLPGLGAFAILQVLLVSFAAPLATLKIMERDSALEKKKIAATLAAILTMSQANAAFPLAVAGLNLPVTMATSMAGGLLAALLAYRLAGNGELKEEQYTVQKQAEVLVHEKSGILQVLFRGGEEGIQVAFKAIPALILAILLVNILRSIGAIDLLETVLSPFLTSIGVPGIAVLPVATKYLAGGTAMMAITLDLVKEGALTAAELNRIAGFMINPLDPVGVAVLVSAGPRVTAQIKPAALGAVAGILVRAVLHFIIF
ncbi:MAG: nucleoside recognition family protein [Bacillota bacterium]|nr:nucleoside recognition family protein [Bacillota bacterium]MDW7685036.1 nucleoside recognition family protein [Bacillota bacterium]